MNATEIVQNSKFFRVTNRRNSTSSVSNNHHHSNGYNQYARNSLVAANASNYNNRINGNITNQYGRRLSSGASLAATNVRRCSSMRQSHNGLFYDADEELYDEDLNRYNRNETYTNGLSTRRASQVDGGYHSNGSLTSSDSYSSYTKYSNKDNPLSSIRVHIIDEPAHCLENVYKVCLLGTHNVGKSNLIDLFRECHSESNSPNNSKSIFHVNINFSEGDIGQFLDDISIRTHSDSFEEADSVISNYPADVYLVMYSVNDRDSFDEAKYILKELQKNNEAKLKFTILVANKTDLVRSRTITTQEGKQLAIDNGCKYVETSCTISHNVHLLLAGIASLINPTIKSNKTSKKSSFFKKLLKKASLSKSKSCHDLHVF